MNAVAEKEKQARAVAERPFVAPDVNIYEMEDGYVLQAEMPGVPKQGLEITLEGNALTFVGHRHEEAMPGHVLYRESRGLNYRRVFELDPAIETGKISAEMRQGVLTLKLPKAERVKPRKIEIQ
ncbi:MAG TPA: Hsp20/alpha crystallin family protein [Methylomirabilota bacterium]|nr:Hsp20/alpha crystallin family protein [Methylomirabilota bacterium]